MYKFKDKLGKIIYVGASKSLQKRVKSYFQTIHTSSRTNELVRNVKYVEFEIINSPNSAFLRERELILLHKPKFNVRWLDDKQYPFLQITTVDKFPRIRIVRNKSDDKNLYFERQKTIKPLKESLKHIRKVFPICDCNKPIEPNSKKRPCLNYDLKLCPAPCVNKISASNYKKNIDNLVLFLEGNTESIFDQWKKEMTIASNNLNFEYAAKIRDRLDSLKNLNYGEMENNIQSEIDAIGYYLKENYIAMIILKINSKQIVEKFENILDLTEIVNLEEIILQGIKEHYQNISNFPTMILFPEILPEIDFFSDWITEQSNNYTKIQIFSNYLNNKWLKEANEAARKSLLRNKNLETNDKNKYKIIEREINKILHTDKEYPLIECIDISTLQGSNSVGSIVAFKNGVPFKPYYRKYRIRSIIGPNDVGSMKEVLTRHFNRKEKDKLQYPDLIVVDGGKSQLSGVSEVINSLNLKVPFIGLAKKREEIHIPNVKRPLYLSRKSPALQLFVALRNEAHRFGITYHRSLRNKDTFANYLEQIPGIGPKRIAALYNEFKTIKNMENASLEDFLKIKTLNEDIAKKLQEFLNKKKH